MHSLANGCLRMQNGLMEAAGIEPASRDILSTGFYVRSRFFGCSPAMAPTDRVLAGQLGVGLMSSPPNQARHEPSLGASLRSSSAKLLGRGRLSRLGSQSQAVVGSYCSVSFLRGPLTNHGTPPVPRLPGRIQFAPRSIPLPL